MVLITSGCITQSRCERKFAQSYLNTSESTLQRDSIIYKPITVEYSILSDTVTAQDTVNVTDETANSKRVTVENAFAKAVSQVVNNKIVLELTQKDTTLLIRSDSLAKEAYFWKDKYESSTMTTIVREPYVPEIYKWLSLIGVLTCIFIIARVFTSIKNFSR